MSFREKFTNLRKKRFIKDVGVLQIGSFVNAGLSFLVSVIFARILGVEGYATYVLIFTFTGLVGLFTNWGEQGVALAVAPEFYERQEKDKFKEVIIYYFFTTFISTIIVSVIALIFAPQWAGALYHNPQIGYYARIIFLMVIFQTFSFFFYAILQIIRKIKHYTALDIFDKASQLAVPALLVLSGFGLWGLVYGKFIMAALSAIVGMIIYHALARRNDFIPTFRELITGLKFSIIKKYFKFGIGISLDKNISNFDNLLSLLLLGYFGTASSVAFYKLGYSYINLPALFLGPIAQLLSVQLPKSKAYGQHILRRDFWRSTLAGGLINIIPVCGLVILAWPLVYFFYGPNFLGSTTVIYYLAFAVILSGFSIGMGSILKTMRKVRTSIFINISVVIIQAGIFFGLYYFHLADALKAVLISQLVVTIYAVALSLYLIDKYLKK